MTVNVSANVDADEPLGSVRVKMTYMMDNIDDVDVEVIVGGSVIAGGPEGFVPFTRCFFAVA